MVDLRVAPVVRSPPALFSLKPREKLAPPPRGGAEEGPVRRGRRGREGVAAAAAVVVACCCCHLNKKIKLKTMWCLIFTLNFNLFCLSETYGLLLLLF